MKLKNCVVGLKVQSKTSGKVGVVTCVEPDDYTGTLTVRVQWDTAVPKRNPWVNHSTLRKVKGVVTVEPLKVGDKVKVLPFTVHESTTCTRVYVKEMLPTIGKVGTVIAVFDTGYRVEFSEGGAWAYCPEYLELVP